MAKSPNERKKQTLVDLACDVCKRIVLMPEVCIEMNPRSCGTLQCDAVARWNEDQWEGRARMAAARQAAGLPVDHLDRMALGDLKRPSAARRGPSAPVPVQSPRHEAREALRRAHKRSKGRTK